MVVQSQSLVRLGSSSGHLYFRRCNSLLDRVLVVSMVTTMALIYQSKHLVSVLQVVEEPLWLYI